MHQCPRCGVIGTSAAGLCPACAGAVVDASYVRHVDQLQREMHAAQEAALRAQRYYEACRERYVAAAQPEPGISFREVRGILKR